MAESNISFMNELKEENQLLTSNYDLLSKYLHQHGTVEDIPVAQMPQQQSYGL